MKNFFWQGPVKKICPKCMILVTSGVIWGDLGTFCDFRMQCVIKGCCQIHKRFNGSVVSNGYKMF